MLIFNKETATNMWIVLEQMNGQNKKDIRAYQLMKDIYVLGQGDNLLSIKSLYYTKQPSE